MVDHKMFLVMLDMWQEARKIEAAKVEKQTAEGKCGYSFEEMEGDKAGEVTSGRL